jgi:hypothetical protein
MIGTLVTLNNSAYQSIGTGPYTITVEAEGNGAISINNAANDNGAVKLLREPGQQIIENSARELFAKGDGHILRIDGGV